MQIGIREVRLSVEPRRLAVTCTFAGSNGTDRRLAAMSNYRQKEETRFAYSRLLSAIYRPSVLDFPVLPM